MLPRLRRRAGKDSTALDQQTALIHIGPHKTGTTTIQSGLEQNHEALAEHGVHYLRPRMRATLGVTAVTGAVPPGPLRDERMLEWERLLADSRGAQRVVLSNEFLCEADRAGAERVVRDLGADDTHIVVTLRPLSAILPSQWQQMVQSGITTTFPAWLDAVLANEPDPTVELFWRRHRHDELIARWADVVGAANLTVIVCDTADVEQLPRVFAELLGVPAELLRPRSAVLNRSFTREEVEVVRRFNEQFEALNARRTTQGHEPLELAIMQRLDAWRHVKNRKPRKDEKPIVLPDSFREPVGQLSREIVAGIASLGVNVVGDLEALEVVPPANGNKTTEPSSVPAGLAARVSMGLLLQVMTPP